MGKSWLSSLSWFVSGSELEPLLANLKSHKTWHNTWATFFVIFSKRQMGGVFGNPPGISKSVHIQCFLENSFVDV